MPDGIKIVYEYPFYADQVRPKGFLSMDKRSHALFHYYLLAQKLYEKAGDSTEDQIIYDDALWMDKPYASIAAGVAIRYALADAGEFLKQSVKHDVELEIARLGFPAPLDEYWNPQPGKVVIV